MGHINENTKRKIIKHFITFLKKKDIYDLYIYNIYVDVSQNTFKKDYWANGSIVNTLLRVDPTLFLNYSFSWLNTRQGLNFWTNVSSKWSYEYRVNIKSKIQ